MLIHTTQNSILSLSLKGIHICIYVYIYRLGGYLILNSTGELRYRFLLNIFFIAPYVAETSFYEKSSFFTLQRGFTNVRIVSD